MSLVDEVAKKKIEKYVTQARMANTHQAKLHILSDLLKDLFDVGLEELIPKIEMKLESKLHRLRGRADLIFSNVVFEIKVDLRKELDDAKQKLIKYLQVLYEQGPERRSIGIATDVLEFQAFTPIIKNSQVVDLKKIGSINIAEANPVNSILWLDSFIFSKSKIRPSAQDLKWRFGPGTATYSIAVEELQRLWSEVENERDAKLKLELWTKNMEIVYGGKPELSSFIDHTYLVTLVKLIVYLRLSGDNMVMEDKIRRALTGEYFSSYGIANLIEEDFFVWILHPKVANRALRIFCDIAKELLIYDLSQLDEDFFKEIYQEIVERGERHRIGEYYTPEWLVQLTLGEAIRLWREGKQGFPRILDPACGSGTFLCNAIHMAREELQNRGEPPDQILDFIISNVVGIDVNPLAVIIARANYLMALGDLLQLGKPIIIPVYVADSIQIPKALITIAPGGSVAVYEVDADGHSIQIPKSMVVQKVVLNQVLEALKDAAGAYKARRERNEVIEIFKRRTSTWLSEDEFEVLKATLNTIMKLMDKGLDSIWIFILKNVYAPIALMESKFDIVVGNPPWIAMRYIENKNYQDFVKQQVLAYELLESSQVHLFTHMEVATLFFCRSSDLYLKDGGIIAFVMPKSVLTGALHHIKFKKFEKPKMKLLKIFDLEYVSPLFNVPSCVLIALKGSETSFPVLARKYVGKLPEKNIKLIEAMRHLVASDYMYKPPEIPTKYSWYHEKFRRGASIYPKNLWFIDFDIHPFLGMDVSRPLVKTSDDAIKSSKEPWKSVKLHSNVEIDFVYATLLSEDIVHFGYLKLRPVVLPIQPTQTGYDLLMPFTLRNKGFALMANWLETAQNIWKKFSTEKSKELFPTIIDRLDYNGLLSTQNPTKRFLTLYNALGTNIASCAVDRMNLPEFCVFNTKVKPRGFIAHDACYFYETNDELEAHYLCAFLNSNVINELIKPLQPRGLFGERGIHRRPFMFPIPKFNENDQLHVKLAKLSKECHAKVSSMKFTKKSAAGLRKEAREAVKEEIAEIDDLVSRLLGL